MRRQGRHPLKRTMYCISLYIGLVAWWVRSTQPHGPRSSRARPDLRRLRRQPAARPQSRGLCISPQSLYIYTASATAARIPCEGGHYRDFFLWIFARSVIPHGRFSVVLGTFWAPFWVNFSYFWSTLGVPGRSWDVSGPALGPNSDF